MNSVSPIIRGMQEHEITLAEDQPQYQPLRVLCINTPGAPVLSRWRLTAEELQAVLDGADIVLTQLTFGNLFQPVHVQVCKPEDIPTMVTA